MKVYEALRYLDIKTEGYGNDFVILNWDDFDTLRESLAGLVELSVVHNSKNEEAYLLKYNIQNEKAIIKNLIDMRIIFTEIILNIDRYVKYDKKKNVITITNNKTKEFLEKSLKGLADIAYMPEELLWVLKIDEDNMMEVYKALVDSSKHTILNFRCDIVYYLKEFIKFALVTSGVFGMIYYCGYYGILSLMFIILGFVI